MLYSRAFIHTTKETPKLIEATSHRLLLRGSYIYMVSSGIYAYLPLGYRVLNKISNIIRKHMDSIGANELLMSALQPIEIWKKTNRDKDLEKIMFRFKDRKDRELSLGPTHEEEITEIVKKYISSYKQLPVVLYQIQVKFRDEPRARSGLIRASEFIMKDAYSFDIDEKGLDEIYNKMFFAYQEIFKECGINFISIEADTGFIGGSFSNEFMAEAPIGEDILFYCNKCNNYFNNKKICPNCNIDLLEKRMIELGHIFKLGTKYSLAQEAFFLDRDGREKPIIMGCYGIGVSRLIPTIVEQNNDSKGIIWPKSVSPFDMIVLVLEEGLLKDALYIEDILSKRNFEVLIDDRKESSGVKFNDSLLLGFPYILVLGKNYLNTKKLDLEDRRTSEKFSLTIEELLNFFKCKI